MFRFKVKKVKTKKNHVKVDVKVVLKDKELKSEFLKKLYKGRDNDHKVR